MNRADPDPPLSLLGLPVVRVGLHSIPLGATRPGQLLAYLACHDGWVARTQLAALFWGDRDEAAARSNLRNLLHQVRRLAWLSGLEMQVETVRWAVESDLQRFRSALARQDAESIVDVVPARLLQGMELNAGTEFCDWLRNERQRLSAQRHEVIKARLDRLAAAPRQCAALSARALAADTLDEVALSAYLRAQRMLGCIEEAQRAYREYAARLGEELGVEPAAALRALVIQPTRAPAIAQAEARASRPDETTHVLVGRRSELAQLNTLLGAGDCRVLTILGPGGVGKSTLARFVAAQRAPQFGDGVPWVPLEDLIRVDQVAPRIAGAIKLDLTGRIDPLEHVVARLQAARMLLVLDNAEHLTGLDGVVATIASACSGVKCLITSRSPLAVAGEWLLPLQGLPVPDRDEDEPAVLRRFDAVRLFEVRARALRADFDPVADLKAVVDLVRVVDGLPLALELAAARVRLLPVREIAREIETTLDIIEPMPGESRRDRSLRASFLHSWRLLAPAEREVLAACTVFVGDFSHEAARQVAGAPVAVLAALADKSLLRAHGDGRFSLHAVVRTCAAEFQSDRESVQRRHADFYALRLAGYAHLKRADPKPALQEIELELANATAAWQYALEAKAASAIEKMAPALRHFFELRGRWAEGWDLLERALAAFDRCEALHARALAAAGAALAALSFRRGRFAQAERLAREALQRSRMLRDDAGVDAALSTIGLSLWQRGDYGGARRFFEQGLRRARAAADPDGIAHFGGNLAIIEKVEGRYEHAVDLYEEALEFERQAGDVAGLVRTLNNLGNVYRVRRQFAPARALFEEGLHACKAHALAAAECFFLVNLAFTHLDLDEADAAAAYAGQAIDAARRHGERQIELMAVLAVARVAIARGDHERADACVREVLEATRGGSWVPAQLPAITVAAEALAARGQHATAATLLHVVARHPGTDHAERDDAQARIDKLPLTAEAARAAAEAAAATTLDAVAAQLERELAWTRVHDGARKLRSA